MKKASTNKQADELRPEYDLSKLKGGVRGKYYEQARAGTNLVLIEQLGERFPGYRSSKPSVASTGGHGRGCCGADAACAPCAGQAA